MNTENLKCVRCGHDLEAYETDENTTYLYCPFCGAKFEETEPEDEEKQEYDFYKNGEDISGRLTEPDIMNGHCLNCGHNVIISGNFMLSDIDDQITEDDDKMSFVLSTCPYCGMSEVRWDTSENDHKIFPYWKEEGNKNEEKQ